jgi:DNA-binding transcriptional ArsR family regulator
LSHTQTNGESWSILHIFGNDIRIEILRLLLGSEMACLTEIAKDLEQNLKRKMTLPAVLKHMKILETAGLVRLEPGIYGEPDARKTLYLLEGKERISKILEHLQKEVCKPLAAGALFSKTAKIARRIQQGGPWYARTANAKLETMLSGCEADNVYPFLTEDERKKVKLWKMMIKILE